MLSRTIIPRLTIPALRIPRSAIPPAQQQLRHAHKDAQDRTSMNTEPNEYSKSGSDAEAAQEGQAFDASKTRPEEHDKGKDDALNVSPANKDVSKGQKGRAEGSSKQSGEGPSDRQRTSGGSGQKDGYKNGKA